MIHRWVCIIVRAGIMIDLGRLLQMCLAALKEDLICNLTLTGDTGILECHHYLDLLVISSCLANIKNKGGI